MRFSTILSFLVALLLAGVAVFGARSWLATQQAALQSGAQNGSIADVEPQAKQTIVVAAEQIAFGERLTELKLREIEWSSDITPEGSFPKIVDLIAGEDDDVARFALSPMQVGEPVLVSKVTAPGQRAKLSTALTKGKKAMSIRVNDVAGVAGFVLPGDRVDVLLTRSSNQGTFVDVLLQGVKVLAIDQIADELKDQPSVVRTITFEVDTQEAQKLVLASSVGTLSLALRNVASSDIEQIDRVTLSDLNDPDVARDLAEARAAELLKNAKDGDSNDPSLQRLVSLEKMLQDLSDGINQRLDGPKEPVVIEKVVERLQPAPKRSTVGVIRNGQRAEYKVLLNEEGEPVGTVQVDPNGDQVVTYVPGGLETEQESEATAGQ